MSPSVKKIRLRNSGILNVFEKADNMCPLLLVARVSRALEPRFDYRNTTCSQVPPACSIFAFAD